MAGVPGRPQNAGERAAGCWGSLAGPVRGIMGVSWSGGALQRAHVFQIWGRDVLRSRSGGGQVLCPEGAGLGLESLVLGTPLLEGKRGTGKTGPPPCPPSLGVDANVLGAVTFRRVGHQPPARGRGPREGLPCVLQQRTVSGAEVQSSQAHGYVSCHAIPVRSPGCSPTPRPHLLASLQVETLASTRKLWKPFSNSPAQGGTQDSVFMPVQKGESGRACVP